MSTLKLIALLLVSFIATGSVIYQMRSRRTKPAAASSRPVAPPPVLPTLAVPQAAPAAGQPSSVTPSAVPGEARTNIPPNGWGRNPFLTRDEINKANQPPVQEIAAAPEAAPTTTAPAGPPTYAVTAIIYGPNGSFAVVNSRVVRAGDRVGFETVKEIKSRAVVLEYDGRTRELPLRRLGPEIQLSIPKGD